MSRGEVCMPGHSKRSPRHHTPMREDEPLDEGPNPCDALLHPFYFASAERLPLISLVQNASLVPVAATPP